MSLLYLKQKLLIRDVHVLTCLTSSQLTSVYLYTFVLIIITVYLNCILFTSSTCVKPTG